MRRNQQCPKCNGRRLWVVERFRIPAETAEGAVLPVVPHQSERAAGLFSLGAASPRGHFDLWICEGCGYSELWASGLSGLRHDPARGVRLVDDNADPQGPFR